jgi:hypothetical protein
MDLISNGRAPGPALLGTLASGVWLGRCGKPLNGILLNVHKLVALAAVIWIVWQLSWVLQGVTLHPLLIVALAVAGLCAAALFASGALMSLGLSQYTVWQAIHVAASLAALPCCRRRFTCSW